LSLAGAGIRSYGLDELILVHEFSLKPLPAGTTLVLPALVPQANPRSLARQQSPLCGEAHSFPFNSAGSLKGCPGRTLA
jgi:hypothetical protein